MTKRKWLELSEWQISALSDFIRSERSGTLSDGEKQTLLDLLRNCDAVKLRVKTF